MASFEWDDRELQAALKELQEKVPNNAKEAMGQACLAIQAKAQENCPHGTGELRRSIQTEVTDDNGLVRGLVGTNLDYSVYVHEGTGIYSRTGAGRKEVPWVYYSDRLGHFVSTSGIKSTPFLQDAVDALAPTIAEYFKRVIDNA